MTISLPVSESAITTLQEKIVPARSARPCNLVFLLDSNYAHAFLVFCFSIRHFITWAHPNIIVYTNDRSLPEDPRLRALVSRFILISQDDIDRLRNISPSNVTKSLRLSFVAKYTFLKFLVFQDLDVEDFIFLDCDMIALDETINFYDIMPEDAGFAACPALGYGTFKLDRKRKTPRSWRLRGRAFARLLELSGKTFTIRRPINSGVFYVKRKWLGEKTVSGLIALAESESFHLEQTVTHRYFRSKKRLRFKSLPLWWNLTYLPVHLIGRPGFWIIRRKVKILHYNRTKPWKSDDTHNWTFRIWRDFERRSRPWIESLVRPDA